MQPIPVAAVLHRPVALLVPPPLMGAAIAFAGQAAIPPSAILWPAVGGPRPARAWRRWDLIACAYACGGVMRPDEKTGRYAVKSLPPALVPVMGQYGADSLASGLRLDRGREARFEKSRLNAMKSLPPGACPGGEAVPAAGVDDGLLSGVGQRVRIDDSAQQPSNCEAVPAGGMDDGLLSGGGQGGCESTIPRINP